MKNKAIVTTALVLGAACVYAGEWEIEIPDGTGDAGWCISLALDENDKPHISYDYGFTGGDNLMYAYKEGSSWYTEVVDDSVEYSMCATSIGVDSNNRPRIAARPSGSHLGLRFAERSGSQWNTVTLDEGVIVQTLALGVDSGDRPHITYDDYEKYELKYAYYDGSSWHIATVDTTPQSPIDHVDMAIDAVDHLHVVFTHDRKLKYAYYDGVSWRFDVIEENLWYTRPSIAVGVNNEPHVIYFDEKADYIKYAYYDSFQWNVENVIKLDPVGTPDPTIAVDAEGEAHIAYSKRNDITDKDLVYGHRKSSTWEFTVVDDEGDLGLFVDIALDSFEFPHIAYHRCTGTTGQLKYAWYHDDIGIDLVDFSASCRSESEINLTWRACATDGENIVGFDLYRRPRRKAGAVGKADYGNPVDASWVKVNSSPIAGKNPYNYRDSGLEKATKYEYRLEALIANRAEALGTAYGSTSAGAKPFALHAAYPNPSRGGVTFAFSLAEATHAELAIYDLAGRRVATPFRGALGKGEHEMKTALDLAPPGSRRPVSDAPPRYR
jgi:hypothetical protein